MKKTLLAVAAALAASVISSQAQVYSQNVVGYYNLPLPHQTNPNNGFYIFANQFSCGVTNGLNEVFAAGGLNSDANGANNTLAYIWVPGSGAGTGLNGPYQYFNAADAAADQSGPTYANGAGFYDGGGNFVNPIVPPGGTVFIKNIASTNITATIVGTVPQGTNTIQILAGYNMIATPIPVGTNLSSSLVGFAGTSDVGGTYNDALYVWSPSGNTFAGPYQYFNAADAAADQSGSTYANGAGFYDGGGNYYNDTFSVGTGFFLYHFGPGGNGTSETFTNIFTVQ